jgi:PAS domain S-box-containing protein
LAENDVPPFAVADLRRRAEERLEENRGIACPSESVEDQLRLVHELQVHQIELEMQNSELRQARDDEAAALEKYTDLYEFAPVGYVTLDRTGEIRSVNLTGSGLMGVERSRLMGRRFGLFVTAETSSVYADFLEKVFTSQAKETCEVGLRKEGASELLMQIEGVAAASGEECRLALLDITERRQAEKVHLLAQAAAEALRRASELAEALRLEKAAAEILRKAKETTEEAARAKSLFFANMSHELRTPMTGILGMLQLTLEEELAPVPRDYLITTQKSAQSLLQILNDILDMSKIEAGKLTIEEKPFSLTECLAEAVDIISPEVRRKGLDFAISAAEDISKTVVGDHARLRQILLNLIGNAVKFTESGKVAVHATAGMMSPEGKREITIAVMDTGIGIPDDKKGLLFQSFSQADASHSRSYGGTGLGLAICREIVELMRGTISFESKAGTGSTFSFTIPLGEAGSEVVAPTAVKASEPEKIPFPEGGRMPHLLLAEDDPTIRQVLAAMLTKSNYRLDVAEDGRKAVEMWETGEYDLLLMDVQMPHLDGFEATRAIRENERKRGGHTTIIAMTAHAGKEDEKQCLAAGMDAYITKPIDFARTLQMIREIIKQKSCGVS